MNEDPVEIKFSEDVKKWLKDNKPKTVLDRQLPTSKHAAGRQKPLSKKDRARAQRKLDRLQQALKTHEIDKRRLNG